MPIRGVTQCHNLYPFMYKHNIVDIVSNIHFSTCSHFHTYGKHKKKKKLTSSLAWKRYSFPFEILKVKKKKIKSYKYNFSNRNIKY